jgi:hypothetical protein
MSHGRPPRRRSAAAFALVALLAISTATPADEPAALGVLVLRNGNVLRGSVRAADGYYSVEQAGAALQVPAEQVEMACRTLEEAYERRRTDRVGNFADAHLELARWCLKNGLLSQAAREVLDARTRDPGHPALPTLDSAIRLGLELEASRNAKGAGEAPGIATESGPAGSAAPITSVDQPSPTSILDPSVEAQTQFVRSIQPMLIQNCATGGCHHTGSSLQMQLDRWALEGNGNPELIRRNLDAVLAQINAEDPPSSAVLVRARQSHGGGQYGRSKPLSTYQAAILLEWLNEAAGLEPEEPGGETAVEQPAAPGAESSVAPPSAAAIRFKPRDAFDPEIFNRRMAAKAPSLADSLSRDGVDDAEIEAAIEAMEQASVAPAEE